MLSNEAAPLSPDELSARWLSVRVDPSLDDLPEGYRLELDQFGDLVVAPRPTNRRQVFAALMCDQLRRALKGFASAGELSIITPIGVCAPDGFWSADASSWAIEEPASRAPEICIAVASQGKSPAWFARRVEAFIVAGAQEVIVVAIDGASARYFRRGGERESSRFAELSFPLLTSSP